MTITDKQIDILESLIVEGIIALTTLPEGKKQYIDRVKNNSSLKFEIKAKQFYAASQRVL